MKGLDRLLYVLGCAAILMTLGGIAAGFAGAEGIDLMQIGAMQVSTVGLVHCLWPERTGLRRGTAGVELAVYTALAAMRAGGLWQPGMKPLGDGGMTASVLLWLALAWSLLCRGRPEAGEDGAVCTQVQR